MYAGSIASWGTVQLDGLVGIPADKKEHFWQESLNASNRLLYGSPFALYEKYPDDRSKNYRNIFLDENNCEVIFSEIYDGKSGKGHSWDMWQNPSGYNAWAGGQQNCVYLEFVESYENIDGLGSHDRPREGRPVLHMDARRAVGQERPSLQSLDLYARHAMDARGSLRDARLPRRHLRRRTVDQRRFLRRRAGAGRLREQLAPHAVRHPEIPRRVVGHDPRALLLENRLDRLPGSGEIYLNFAEAAFELNKPDSALWAVNKIRARAGMPELQSITREQIRHERKIELAFEGNRYWTYAAGGPPYKTSRTLGTACATSSTGQRRNTMSRSSTTSAERPNPISTRCTTTGLSHKAEPNRIRTCCPTIRAGGNTLSLFCSLLRAADVARSSFFANLHSQTP